MATTLSRRSFIKLGAAAAAGGLAGGLAPQQSQGMGTPPNTLPTGPITQVKGFCPFCQVRCTYQAQVQDGRVVSLVGDPGNRWTGGAMCPKGMSIVELVGSPSRITEPMLKVNGEWKKISYPEALDLVAEKVSAAMREYGDKINEHVALTMPLWDCRENELAALMTMRLIGCVNNMPAGEVCISSASNTLSWFLGANTSTTTVNELLNTRTLILWGANINELYPPYTRWLEMARDKGVKIVYIDCRKTRSSIWSNEQYMPRPGTDGALVFGLIRHVIETGAYDPALVERTTTDFAELRDDCKDYTPERVAELTGLPVEQVLALCKTVEDSPSTILWLGGSLSRYTNGIHTIRALISLQGVTNNLIGPGKGILTMEGGKPEGEKEFVDEMCGEAKAQGVNFRRLLALMKKGSLDVLFLNSSYRRYPDTKGVREALKKVKFIVHRGFFMEPETEACDLFLPATFSPESSGSHYGAEKQVVWRNKAVDAPGACVPDWQFYRDLGRKLFPDKYPQWENPAELYELFRKTIPSWTGMTLERLEKSPDGVVWPVYELNGPERLGTIFDKGVYLTEDGKLPFSSNLLGPIRWDYPKGSPYGKDKNPEYPLTFTQGKILTQWQQTLTNYSGALAAFSNGRTMSVHPETAKQCGVVQGDKVVLETPTGSLEGRADVTDTIMPGIVFTPSHFIPSSPFEQTRGEPVNNVVPNVWDRISAQFNGGGCRLRKA